jgi:hypothetical protein
MAIDDLLDKVPLPGIYRPVTLFNYFCTQASKDILSYKNNNLIHFRIFRNSPFKNFYRNNYIFNIFDPNLIYRPVTLYNHL